MKTSVMAVEIERKFLVSDDGYRAVSVGSIEMVQGYLAVERGRRYGCGSVVKRAF